MTFNEIILTILILLLTIGFTLLSLSLSRHYSHVSNKRQRLGKSAILLFRFIGYSFLIAAAILSISFWGIALGLVYLFATTTLVAIVLSTILTFKPRWLSLIPLSLQKFNVR
jgi:hypothetical protein